MSNSDNQPSYRRILPFQVIIRSDRAPSNEHRGRYNRPSRNNKGIAVVFDDEPTGHRDIVLKQHDNILKRINEMHPGYDALQYPLLFPVGEDGYHISSAETNMKHYSFKIMIRRGNARFVTSGAYHKFPAKHSPRFKESLSTVHC